MTHHNPRTKTLVLNMPLNLDPEVCAVVFDPESQVNPTTAGLEPYDECGNWETALQYAQDGYVVIAMNPSHYPFVTTEILQEAIIREQELIADCFGKPPFPQLVEV